MSYTKFVNFITKNAVVATIIMVLAVGGMTTVAAEYLAPQSLKPSNILGFNNNTKSSKNETKEEKMSKIQIYEDEFYYDLKINYDSSWLFSMEVKEANMPELLDKEIVLKKDDTVLKFEIAAVKGTAVSGCSREEWLEKVNIKGNLNRFKSERFDSSTQWVYQKSEQLHSCPSFMLKTKNLDEKTNQDSDIWGLMEIYLIEGNSSELSKEADQIVVDTLSRILDLNEQTPPEGEEKISQLSYTNPKYPKLKINYPNGWVIEEKFDNSKYITILSFKKKDLVLEYKFTFVRGGIGMTGMFCTNNQNLFSNVGNGWWRIKDNPNNYGYSVYYNTSVFPNYQMPYYGEVVTDMSKINTEWVRNPEANKTYKACQYPPSMLTPSTFMPDEGEESLIFVGLKGENLDDQSLLKEADQIVASTKF